MDESVFLSKWIKIVRNRLPRLIDTAEEHREYIRTIIEDQNDFVIKNRYKPMIRVYGGGSHWIYRISKSVKNESGWTKGFQPTKELAMLCADIEAVKMGYNISDPLLIIQ